LEQELVICKFCKKNFYSNKNKNRVYCSQKCSFSNRRKKNNSNWKGGPPALICRTCGKTFHNKKKRIFCSMKCRNIGFIGKNNPNWDGGFRMDNGYLKIHSPNHPFRDKQNYVMKHRLIIEKKIGRFLTKNEVVHHKNGLITDNRISNLVLCENQAEHRRHHAKS